MEGGSPPQNGATDFEKVEVMFKPRFPAEEPPCTIYLDIVSRKPVFFVRISGIYVNISLDRAITAKRKSRGEEGFASAASMHQPSVTLMIVSIWSVGYRTILTISCHFSLLLCYFCFLFCSFCFSQLFPLLVPFSVSGNTKIGVTLSAYSQRSC